MLSARSAGPYRSDMPIRPRPSWATSGPVLPSLRVCIADLLQVVDGDHCAIIDCRNKCGFPYIFVRLEITMDQIRAMQIFQAVADARSFTQAAEHLDLPRPSVTNAVQAIEQQL